MGLDKIYGVQLICTSLEAPIDDTSRVLLVSVNRSLLANIVTLSVDREAG